MNIKLSKKNKKNKKITQNGSGDVNRGTIVYNNSTIPDHKPKPIVNNELYNRVVRQKVQPRVTIENTRQTLREARMEAGIPKGMIRGARSRIGFKRTVEKKGGSRINQKRVTKRSTYRRVNNKRRTHKRK